MNTNKKSDSISFSGPNKARYELEQKVIKYYMREKRNEGLPITREVICVIKVSEGWCVQMMKRVLMLWRRTTLAQHPRAEYVEKLISFQHQVNNLRKKQLFARPDR